MIKIESESLESAYAEAAARLECSVTELHIEIVQHPKSGFLSFFKKTAIIVATCKLASKDTSQADKAAEPIVLKEETEVIKEDEQEAEALEKSFSHSNQNQDRQEH